MGDRPPNAAARFSSLGLRRTMYSKTNRRSCRASHPLPKQQSETTTAKSTSRPRTHAVRVTCLLVGHGGRSARPSRSTFTEHTTQWGTRGAAPSPPIPRPPPPTVVLVLPFRIFDGPLAPRGPAGTSSPRVGVSVGPALPAQEVCLWCILAVEPPLDRWGLQSPLSALLGIEENYPLFLLAFRGPSALSNATAQMRTGTTSAEYSWQRRESPSLLYCLCGPSALFRGLPLVPCRPWPYPPVRLGFSPKSGGIPGRNPLRPSLVRPPGPKYEEPLGLGAWGVRLSSRVAPYWPTGPPQSLTAR